MTPTPLYERDDTLARLAARVGALSRDGGGVVLLVGESGVGKTSLVQQLRQRAGARTEWLACSCEPLLAPPPLAPLIDLLPALPPSLAAAVQAARLTPEALAGFASRLLSGPGARVLVVDDAQWADGATLELLRHLGRRCRESPLLLLLVWRDEDAAALVAFEATLAGARIWREPLAPLSAAAVAQWATRRGRPARGLHALTQGNPYFVSQLLDAEPQHQDAHARSLPSALRDAVMAQALPLAGAARDALELAALAPGGLALATMGAVLDAPEQAVAPGVAAGLLVNRHGRVGFRHELARQAVEAALPPPRAAALHQALFDTLACQGASVARLVHHAVRGGLGSAVARLAPQAAHEAAAGGAWREAAELFALARQHADASPAAEQAALAVAHAQACVPANRLDDALTAWTSALALHRALGDLAACARDERERARLHWMRGRSPQALPHAQAALDLLDRLPPAPRERAETLATLADLHMLDLRADRAGELAAAAEQALSEAEAGGMRDDGLRAYVLCMRAGARLRRADDDTAWQALRSSLALAQAAGDRERVLRACMGLATMGLVHHRRDHAVHALREGLAYCEANDIDLYAARLKIRLAYGTLFQGGMAEAAAMLRELRAESRLPPLEDEQSWHALMLVGLRAGDSATTPYWRALIAGSQRMSVDPWHAPQDLSCIEAAWLFGDADGARRVLTERALPAALASGEGWRIGALRVWALRLGLAEAAAVPFESDSPPCEPLRLELAGATADAADAWAGLGCHGEELLTLLHALDDEPALLERARELAEDGGALALASHARARLRALGRDPARRRVTRGLASVLGLETPAADGLSRREREVLDGIERGQSNHAIAEALGLSERTVQGHVVRLLAKLGASRRSELARRGARSRLASGDRGQS